MAIDTEQEKDHTVQYAGKDRSERYVKYRPKPPSKVIECILEHLKEKFNGRLELAIDVGCGNGQCTDLVASHFDRVIGTDVSASQIELALDLPHPENVEFRVSTAEQYQPDVRNGSVQLVTVAIAAHWFDMPSFYKEVNRVLCPNGILAIFAYSQFPSFEPHGPQASDLISKAYQTLFYDRLGPFWAPGAFTLFNEYEDIILPFKDFVRKELWFEESFTLANLANYLSSVCGYQNFCKAHGDEAGRQIMTEFTDSIRKALHKGNEPLEKVVLRLKRKTFILIGRKSEREE